MLKPGLWPPIKPRTTESHAELAFYDALAKQLPKGWYAWHSLRIRVPGHSDAEADFVIVDPAKGILIVEVKGGRIEKHDGTWFSNGIPLKQAPREQANRFLHELLRILHDANISPPPCGIATCFPDTEFSSPPTEGDLAGCVLGSQDLLWLGEALPTALQNALASGYRPKGKWLQAIHNLWDEVWVPRIDFGMKARVEREERIRLDKDQFTVLQGLLENDSVLVSGAAGTGKTVLALEVARKLASEGKKVLLLCFTEPLARWLSGQVDGANLSVRALKRYAVELLKLADRDVEVADTAEFWRSVSLDAAACVLPNLRLDWDAIVVDESQDLGDEDWLFLEELSKGRRLWGFWDPEQCFWPDRKVRQDLFKARYCLQKRYRCPAAIQALANSYLGTAPDPDLLAAGIEEGRIAVRRCPGPGTIVDRIATEIDKLRASGLENADIAVLSLRGATEAGSVIHRDRFGTHRAVRAHDPDAGSNVVVETFLRFKGLERPAIIITDLSLAIELADYARRMYIALTRSLSVVRIIDVREALALDRTANTFCELKAAN